MKEKLLEILGSVRFWFTIIGAVVYYLGAAGVIPITITEAILGFLGVGVLVRTADSVLKK